MGYTTDFEGDFEVTPPLNTEHAAYLTQFSGTRRMKREESRAKALPDPHREAVGLPVGAEGEFFVGGAGFAGQGNDLSVINHNRPPSSQPGLWCQWVPIEESGVYSRFGWNGGEKFYNYIEWLEYLIKNLLEPWGYALNGEVTWQGEERDDIGKLIVTNNKVSVKNGTIKWE